MDLRAIALTAIWLLATGAHGQPGAPETDDMTAESFKRKLEQAAEFNTTAPWPESQKVLDELRPHLELATEDQYAEFAYLEARNLTLAGNSDKALAVLERTLERGMSEESRIRVLRLAANVAVNARRYEQAFDLLVEALALAEDRPEEVYIPELFSLASYLYTQVGALERALQYGRAAVEHAQANDNLRARSAAEQRLAYVHKVAGDFDPSEELYRKAIEHGLEAGDELMAGVAEAGLADLLRAHGRHEGAGELFERSIERLERTGYASGVAEARLYRARLESALGNDERVQTLLLDSSEQFEAEQSWDYLAEAHRILADIERGRGNLDRAFEHYDIYMDAREKHLSMENDRQLAYLQVEFDLQSKNQQLALLQEKARVSELQAETRRQQFRLTLIGYGAVSVLLVVLIFLLIHATRERRRFQSLSQRDGLTALSNHTRFFELAEQACDLCRRKNLPFILILADIDHFKQVNDRNGHIAGDEVLRLVGSRLREAFGKKGIIGRIGGEEFGIAVPGQSLMDVEHALKDLRVSLTEVRASDQPIPVTMSFGVALRRDKDESLSALRERADEALYRAKRAGRDRIVQAGA